MNFVSKAETELNSGINFTLKIHQD